MKLSTMQKMTQGLVLTIIVIVIAGAMDYYNDMKRPKIATIDILTLVKEHEKKLTDLLYQGVKNLDSANVDLAQQSKIADIEKIKNLLSNLIVQFKKSVMNANVFWLIKQRF